MSTPLSPEVETSVYLCHNCKGKNTYGRDYWTEVGVPQNCPTCETPYIQEDKIDRLIGESVEEFEVKKDLVLARRGEIKQPRIKPTNPDDILKDRIDKLEDELKRLKENRNGNDIRLGP